MIADLDNLLIALYVELTDRMSPTVAKACWRLGRPPEVAWVSALACRVAGVGGGGAPKDAAAASPGFRRHDALGRKLLS